MTAPNEVFLHIGESKAQEADRAAVEKSRAYGQLIADLIVKHEKELADRDREIARLQARLKACPTVEQLREWALSLPKGGYRRSAEQMIETANRMEAANAE